MSIGGFHDKNFCYNCFLKNKKIETLRAIIKDKEERIKLLIQCDDSSTEAMGKIDKEIEELKAENKKLKG